jgi:hypothetical protein
MEETNMGIMQQTQHRRLMLGTLVAALVCVGALSVGAAASFANAKEYYTDSTNVCVGFGPPLAAGSCEWGTHVTGGLNVALGDQMMSHLTSGENNVALDFGSLGSVTTASNDVAIGKEALAKATTAGTDVAIGSGAGESLTTGESNVAAGVLALEDNKTGAANISIGEESLQFSEGSGNIAVGNRAGFNTRKSSNIDIGNAGEEADEATTRIGNGQTRAFMAGIYNVQLPVGSKTCKVLISSTGQLACSVAKKEKAAVEVASLEAQVAHQQQEIDQLAGELKSMSK